MIRPLFQASRRTVLAAALVLAATPAVAQDIASASRAFIERLTETAVRELTDKNLSDVVREQRFRTLFTESFDVPAIGRFVVGAPNWRQATETQRSEYLQLFEATTVRTYSQRFTEYSGEQIRIVASRAESDQLALVTANVITASGPARVDFRVLRTEAGLRVVDLLIEGASLASSQREEFTSVIQRGGGGLQPLIDVLRQRVQRAG